MRFGRVILENWRNFTHVDVALQERAFLVGPNASGKSNFLDVFRFLRDVAQPVGGFERAVTNPTRGGVSRIRALAARRYSDVAIEVGLHDSRNVAWRYRLAFNQDNRRRPVIREEKVWHGADLVLERPDNSDREDPERLRQTHLEQVFVNQPFREIADFFASVRYYHIVPQLVRDPNRSVGIRGDPYGGDFLEQIARTDQRTRSARLRRILVALKVAVPQLSALQLEEDERGVPHLRGRYEHWRPQGAWQTEADFSDGTLRLMGLLWALLEGSGPLLLEEPELSLHPGVVPYLPQVMLRVQRDRPARQILLSTHSADLLQDEGVAPDEILPFMPEEEGATVQSGATIEEVHRLLDAGLSPAEVVIPHTRPANVAQLAFWGEE